MKRIFEALMLAICCAIACTQSFRVSFQWFTSTKYFTAICLLTFAIYFGCRAIKYSVEIVNIINQKGK